MADESFLPLNLDYVPIIFWKQHKCWTPKMCQVDGWGREGEWDILMHRWVREDSRPHMTFT